MKIERFTIGSAHAPMRISHVVAPRGTTWLSVARFIFSSGDNDIAAWGLIDPSAEPMTHRFFLFAEGELLGPIDPARLKLLGQTLDGFVFVEREEVHRRGRVDTGGGEGHANEGGP